MIVLKYPLGFVQWRTLVSWHKVLSSVPSPEMRRKGTTILREGSLLHSLDFEVVFSQDGFALLREELSHQRFVWLLSYAQDKGFT